MRRSEMQQIKLLTVEMHMHGVVIGEHRPGFGRVGRLIGGGADGVDDVVPHHHVAGILLADEPGAFRPQRQISVGMVVNANGC